MFFVWENTNTVCIAYDNERTRVVVKKPLSISLARSDVNSSFLFSFGGGHYGSAIISPPLD
jgi:hypothetical protein